MRDNVFTRFSTADPQGPKMLVTPLHMPMPFDRDELQMCDLFAVANLYHIGNCGRLCDSAVVPRRL